MAVGQVFGRWTVVRAGKLKQYGSGAVKTVVVRCECGVDRTVGESVLVLGKTKSCGCLRRDKLLKSVTTHGLSKHPLYSRWKSMMDRCSPGNKQYKDYGGRGIKVCKRWKNPEVFISDIESSIGLCPPGMSFDRIDNDGNYEPGNVRWATHSQQMRNRRY